MPPQHCHFAKFTWFCLALNSRIKAVIELEKAKRILLSKWGWGKQEWQKHSKSHSTIPEGAEVDEDRSNEVGSGLAEAKSPESSSEEEQGCGLAGAANASSQSAPFGNSKGQVVALIGPSGVGKSLAAGKPLAANQARRMHLHDHSPPQKKICRDHWL